MRLQHHLIKYAARQRNQMVRNLTENGVLAVSLKNGVGGQKENKMSLSLVVEALEEDTNCISSSVCFNAKDITELGCLLQIDFSDDQEIDYQYYLDRVDLPFESGELYNSKT
jgi:hypothetical protein